MTDTITLPRKVIERTLKCLNTPENQDLRLVSSALYAALAQQAEPLVTYRHKDGTTRFEQYAKNPVPVWAVDVQPVAQQGWQTIESAPRETEIFIGRFIDGVFKFGKSEMFYEQANEFAGETFSGWIWSEDDCSSSIADSPTYWMPLPTPPKEIK